MRPFDPDNDNPLQWRAEYNAWRAAVRAARTAQLGALRELHAAQVRLAPLVAWRDQLAAVVAAMQARLGPYAALDAELARLAAALDGLEAELDDRLAARDTATSRLLDGPSAATPLTLLPLRLQTAWRDGGLVVRVFPAELSVDRHDPRLSPVEVTLGAAYWATRGIGGPAQEEQAWRDLTSRLTPARAAWVARATDPAGPAAQRRAEELDLPVAARLLPQRFAVVLLLQGEPVDVAVDGGRPAYVTWGKPVQRDLVVPVLHDPQERLWTTDLDIAVTAGMAVRVPLPPAVTRVDEVVVVGVCAGTSGADLGALVGAHAFTVGAEVLAAGAATNNTADDRTTRTAEHEREVGRRLLSPPNAPAPGSAGAALAAVLGVPAGVVGRLAGADQPWDDLGEAVADLVAVAATGTLLDAHSGSAAEVARLLRPGGPAPVLRVGSVPYGVLPTLDLSRYAAGPDAPEAGLARVVRTAAHRQQVPLDVDPADPVPPRAPRRVTPADDSDMATLLVEAATATRWSVRAAAVLSTHSSAAGPTEVAGEVGLLGTVDGPGSPQAYLPALAAGSTDPSVADAAAASVLGALAVVASAEPAGLTLLTRLAAVLADHGRPAVATALAAQLDAVSHRADAWVTALARHRLSAATVGPVVGAYGYATDLAPRRTPRSFGHVHAPSAAHAATAAVLRSGYLGQRRAAWVQRLAEALAAGDTAAEAVAREGLASLATLDDRTESRLPLAVDLSSRRVRRARDVLGAVRAGTALGVVLGRQVERDLVRADLSAYLAPLRKLTRFTAGTALEALEESRRQAVSRLAAVEVQVDALAEQEAAARAANEAAQLALAAAQAEYDAATRVFAPYAVLEAERGQVQVNVDAALARVAALDADRPTPGSHDHSVDVP